VDGNDVEDQEPCPSDDEEVAAAWVRQAEEEGSGAPKPARLLCGGRAASAATSLSRHPLYRRSAWRAVVPATIFGTAGLFLASALPPYGIGATVDLRVAVAGEPIELQRLFQFTLAGSVHDAWHAGVYPLSLLIALLSGIWPYVKLMLMLACWCAACHSVLPPPSPPGARGCIAPHPFPLPPLLTVHRPRAPPGGRPPQCCRRAGASCCCGCSTRWASGRCLTSTCS
jgi:hypothetical protein